MVMLAEHWVLRCSQGPEGKQRQQAATLWLEEPDTLPTAEYIVTRAKAVEFSLLDIFGWIAKDREWTIAHTLPMVIYGEEDVETR